MKKFRPRNLPSKILKAEEVAEILGTSASFVYALMRRGELPVVRLGRSVRVRPEDLEAFINNCVDQGNYGTQAW